MAERVSPIALRSARLRCKLQPHMPKTQAMPAQVCHVHVHSISANNGMCPYKAVSSNSLGHIMRIKDMQYRWSGGIARGSLLSPGESSQ